MFVTIILSVFIVLCILGMIWSLYMLNRNDKVADFRKYVLRLNYELSMNSIDHGIQPIYGNLYNKLPSYDEMMSSFDDLTLETYFSREEIDVLLSGGMDKERN